LFLLLAAACSHSSRPGRAARDAAPREAPSSDASATGARLPLTLVADVDVPGESKRFDYQDIDAAKQLLVVAHMNDNAVLILDLKDGSVKKRLTGIPRPRGVAIASDIGVIFVTSTPKHLVLIDTTSLTEITRVETGAGPDGDAWDPADKIVGVSDQGDGALSLISDAGRGTRKQVALGTETGNVVYDAARGQFWITVVGPKVPDQLVEIDPKAATITTRIPLPGCTGAHGLRLHPDGQSAFIACEENDTLARVDLTDPHAVTTLPTGSGPDVLSIDPGLGWLYVAAESGDLTVFDISQPDLVLVGHDQPGPHSHSVVADPATHRVFFPLLAGPSGTPVVRIMRPTGSTGR
jgi:DNA-binding beta-propeller fold protein YncE